MEAKEKVIISEEPMVEVETEDEAIVTGWRAKLKGLDKTKKIIFGAACVGLGCMVIRFIKTALTSSDELVDLEEDDPDGGEV